MPTPCSRTGDATESSEDHPMVRAISASAHERDLPRLPSLPAFPNQPRHLRPHRIPEHARSVVVGREGQERFQVDRTGRTYPPRCGTDAAFMRGAPGVVSIFEADPSHAWTFRLAACSCALAGTAQSLPV